MISTPALIGLAGLGAVTAAATGCVAFGGWNVDAASAAARYTARFSFPWFAAAWSASALAALWPGGWRSVMLRRRRAIGLGFAAAHGVHFAALLAVVLAFGRQPSVATLYGGSFGYLVVAVMALTSNDQAVRMLGPKHWKLLHTAGAVVIAAIFAVSYQGRLAGKPWLAIPALALLGCIVVLKLAAWFKKRAPRAAAL